MKKIFTITLTLLLASILMVGCSDTVEENNLFEEGKLLLEKHEYNDAKDKFSQLLHQDVQNEAARAMYTQAIRMQTATHYEKTKNYKKAIMELEVVEGIKNGSEVIKKEASEKKKSLQGLDKEYELIKEQRKENAKVVAARDKSKVESRARQAYINSIQAEYDKKQDEKEQQQNQEKPDENTQNEVNTNQ